MGDLMKVIVPDLGGANEVDVIEVMVAPGDNVSVDAALIMLEGDKATMEVPSPYEGIVKTILVKEGDKISEGALILELESKEADLTLNKPNKQEDPLSNAKPTLVDVLVPDLSGASEVDLIEIMVSTGDRVDENDSIAMLEGDKATMEIPCGYTGVVKTITAKVGDKLSEGDRLLQIEAVLTKPASTPTVASVEAASTAQAALAPVATGKQDEAYAGPSVRRLARVLDIALKQIRGTGHKGRVTREDLDEYIKARMSGVPGIKPAPVVDFGQFGEIDTMTLSKIKRLTGEVTHRSWNTIPHVTQFDEADITELESFRKANKAAVEKQGAKLTPIVFIMKVLADALREFPTFNASLKPNGEELVLKKYFHIGVAVDTPNGLVVPVIRDVDKKSVVDLALELGAISLKAREKGLSIKEMQGSSMTISSLGGIGGTAFTPIVNAPDVAILGLSKSKMQPVYNGTSFDPRLMLPLSLSYDHRVIDGAQAARFTKYLAELLSDSSRLAI